MQSYGVYGLRLAGVALPRQRLVALDDRAPVLTISLQVGAAGQEPSFVGDHCADLKLLGGGRLVVDRSNSSAEFTVPSPVTPEDLLHPYLAPAASLVQQWRGLEVLHGGAFAVEGGALAVLGGRGDGKSSTLAWLAAELGVSVLSDDLLVLDEGQVLAGPRCIDLRPELSGRYADRWAGRLVRSEQRVRLGLPQSPARTELIGVVTLAWGPSEITEVRPSQRVHRLLEQRMFGVLRGDPEAVLHVASLPFWTVRRPHQLDTLPATAEALLSLVS